MRGSLQDQLIQSGIATEKQLEKKKPSTQRSKNNQKKNKAPQKKNPRKAQSKPQPEQSSTTLGKALRTEIKQLLKQNKLNDKTGEIPYNYAISGQVKRFYITEDQQKKLKSGEMVIVNWNTISYLISSETEVALRKLHPTIEVASVSKTNDSSSNTNSDYPDHDIPDDLMW